MQIIPHKHFFATKMSFNIALLRLSQKLNQENVSEICLPSNQLPPMGKENCSLVGWNCDLVGRHLLQIDAKIVPDDFCSNLISGEFDQTMFCTVMPTVQEVCLPQASLFVCQFQNKILLEGLLLPTGNNSKVFVLNRIRSFVDWISRFADSPIRPPREKLAMRSGNADKAKTSNPKLILANIVLTTVLILLKTFVIFFVQFFIMKM